MNKISVKPEYGIFYSYLTENKYHNSANAFQFLLLRADFLLSNVFENSKSTQGYFEKIKDDFYSHHMHNSEFNTKPEVITSKDYAIHLLCLKVLITEVFPEYVQAKKNYKENEQVLKQSEIKTPKVQDFFNSFHNYPHISFFDDEQKLNPKSYYLNLSPHLRSITEVTELLQRTDIQESIHKDLFGGEILRTKINSNADFIKNIELYNQYIDLRVRDMTKSITSLKELQENLSFEKSNQVKEDLKLISINVFGKEKGYKTISKIILDVKRQYDSVNS